ncbi:hypothetical protein GCM10010121_051270 [Streptomyces brasiliensis]|uniref:Uncharacterized protein n=1 Tax=Streptomyces brasiliensis TaxID=1954 RepID=A0A917NX63_9ACTN|nr:hypothetical protein GCM10010121_051270 [Streptomyces brasiliensis]
MQGLPEGSDKLSAAFRPGYRIARPVPWRRAHRGRGLRAGRDRAEAALPVAREGRHGQGAAQAVGRRAVMGS